MLTKIQKRDGRTVPFNIEKIADAIYKAARAVGGNVIRKPVKWLKRFAIILRQT